MLIEDWMHKKAEESAHNEILAFLLIILGIHLLTAGLLVTLIVLGELDFWLLSLNTSFQTPSSSLGLILTLTGFLMSSSGFILVIHYDRKKSWYRKQIETASMAKKMTPKVKRADEILEEYSGKKG